MADGQAAAIHIPKESDNVTTDKAHSPPSLVLEQTKEKQMGKLGGPSSPDDAQETNSLSETHRTSDEVAQPDSEDRGDFNSSHSELSGQDNADISQNPALKEGQSKGKGKQRMPRKKDPNLRLAELGKKGTGFVKNVKEAGFGFINSPELDEQLFFHASELVRPEEQAKTPFLDFISPGDEVEFVVGQNTGSRMNLVAQKVQKLPPNTVKAQILSEEYYQGHVSKELNSGSWRAEGSGEGQITFQRRLEGQIMREEVVDFHKDDVYKVRQFLKMGTIVQFYICTDNQTKARRAVHVEVVKDFGNLGIQAETVLHGFIKDLSKTGGVLRCLEADKRFTFRTLDVTYEPHTNLVRGQAVMFSIMTDQKGHERVTSMNLLPEGSLSVEKDLGVVQGRVVRQMSGDKGQNVGLIITPQYPTIRVNFDAESSSDPALELHNLEVDDEVECRVLDNVQYDIRLARNLRLLSKGKENRELGQVRTKKSNFGFIACCQRSGQLFFHSSALQDCEFEDLKKGDDVEFSVERHPERGTMAVRVKKAPEGSAIFETVSELTYLGTILVPPQVISQGVTSSGVLEFEDNGVPAKLLFTANDFKEEVRAGDYARFQIADNVKAAKQVESLGSTVSRMIGRRAANGNLLKLNGTVKQIQPGYGGGFLTYSETQNSQEKRLFFHFNEVVDQLELKVGDEISFILTKGPKMREDFARKVVRIKEAPQTAQEEQAKPIPKSGLNLSQQTVRTPLMPDGTKGFYMGRGGKLPTFPPQQNGAPPGIGTEERVPGKILVNSERARLAQNQPTLDTQFRNSPPPGMQILNASNGIQPRIEKKKVKKTKNVSNNQEKSGSPQPNSILQASSPLLPRTSSGLNPHAAEFQPRGQIVQSNSQSNLKQ